MAISGERMFVLAVENLAVTAGYVGGEGWTLHMATRRQGEGWDDSNAVHYDHLTTSELLDVLDVEMYRQLGA